MKKSRLKRKSGLKGGKVLKNRRGRERKKRRYGGSDRWKQIKKADAVFSQLVRLTHADEHGYCRCFTCGRRGYWKRDFIECGHFRTRTHIEVRWYMLNARPQCVECNQHNGGMVEVFAERLGEENVAKIDDIIAEGGNSPSAEEIRKLRLKMEKSVEALRRLKGI